MGNNTMRFLRLSAWMMLAVMLSGCSGCSDKAAERDRKQMRKAIAFRNGDLSGKTEKESPDVRETCIRSFFSESLHYTGEGMRYWYEGKGGFKEITGIPYADLDCKNCHVQSCDTCHAGMKGEKHFFSEAIAKDMNTCLPCHGREALAFKLDEKNGTPDVHIRAGMVCSDCHYRSDVHGDGRFRESMRHTKGVRATCEECHVEQERESPLFDPESESHRLHMETLNCSACHVQSSVSCYNCHFDNFVKTGKRKGNFLPMKDWVLLINHEGKVTSGNVQTLTYRNRKFVAYAPYFTHSISAKGRACADCHRNEAVQMIENGEKVPVVRFENGSLQTWKGVVPVMKGKLDWVFLDKSEKGWETIPDKSPPLEQYVGFGTPLTDEQFDLLATDVSE